MDRLFRPERFDTDPQSTSATKEWNHWLCTFESFLLSIVGEVDKRRLLFTFVSPTVYEYISQCPTFESCIETLNKLYIKPKNEIFARYLLSTTKQQPGEPLDQFLQKLLARGREIPLNPVSPEIYREELVRDAFISGMDSPQIRERLLEHQTLSLQSTVEKARALEIAHIQSQQYHSNLTSCAIASDVTNSPNTHDTVCAAQSNSNRVCFFCGYALHPRTKCPAREALCKGCGKKGHFLRVCNSRKNQHNVGSTSLLSALTTAAAPSCLQDSVAEVYVNGIKLQALIDTGSSESYVSFHIVQSHGWKFTSSSNRVTMASTTCLRSTEGHIFVTLTHKDNTYSHVKLSILRNLCADVLLGHDFLRLHKSVQIPFDGSRPPFRVCSVAVAKITAAPLFEHLSKDCRPIATKSRRQNAIDETFIHREIHNLLKDSVIEPSRSPWRAQVFVVHNEKAKPRMVVDYSQTINRFTSLDAYPLPKIDELVEKISKFSVFSTLDLKSAYHQVPILEKERKYTAFEADGRLYQFCRIPFGVTNGVAAFQRVIDNIIATEDLKNTFVYVDNVTIAGINQEDHDKHLKAFMDVVDKYGLTLNHDKSMLSTTKLTLLGYEISSGTIRPDPERLRPLQELPPPTCAKEQQRTLGMFAYYSQWIRNFSDKVHPLIKNVQFPIPSHVRDAFDTLKKDLIDATISTINHNDPLVIETDASDVAIAATLNQNNRPVAFFSRTLASHERHHPAIEKEACAIVEALRKWRHFLIGRHFTLVTDQRSISFMFDNHSKGKIKNEKIQRWRLELMNYCYDVIYRPGTENQPADTLSRHIASIHDSDTELYRLHTSLCHPGITRMTHFVRVKNLPYSVEEVKSMTAHCRTCAELKPRFHQPADTHLIRATRPFDRLSLDFKGPLPSVTPNKYLLTIIDEYSRFPFAYPCANMSSATVISCLTQLFALFGMPACIHSDRGSSFISTEVTTFLRDKGIAISRTTAYNPQGNGQVERLNGTLWQAISLALKSTNLQISQWETVYLNALHSIRSLLCTSTNETPHERIFQYSRKSTFGSSIPSWLSAPGKVLMRRLHRASKYEPLVEEVDLLHCNPTHAFVRLQNGREETVSLRHLSPNATIDDPQDPDSDHNAIPDSNTEPQTSTDCERSAPPDQPESHSHPRPSPSLLEQQQRTRPYILRNREA